MIIYLFSLITASIFFLFIGHYIQMNFFKVASPIQTWLKVRTWATVTIKGYF